MRKSSNKKSNLIRYSILIFIISIIAIASIFDLHISIKLYDPDNRFAKLFECIGEWPLPIMTSFWCCILIRSKDTKKISTILWGLQWIWCLLVAAYYPFMYKEKLNTMDLILIFLLLILLLILNWKVAIRNAANNHTIKVAQIGAILFIILMISINILKIFWGRERFMHLEEMYVDFTPWYIVQPFAANNNYMSFPSGHVANASALLILPLLFKSSNKNRYAIFMYGGILIWILLVAFSRIVIGAHYLTDVIAGFFICTASLKVVIKHYMPEKKIFSFSHDY